MTNGNGSKYRNGWWVVGLLATAIVTAAAAGSIERWAGPDPRTDQEIRKITRDEMRIIQRDLTYIKEQIGELKDSIDAREGQ